MSVVNKALCGFFGLSVVLFAGVSVAEETQDKSQPQKQEDSATVSKSRAVLFKIHDVTPVKNVDGLITDCDFLVTFYNRTPTAFQSAKLELGWTDDVSERYTLDLEEPQNTPERRSAPTSRRNEPKSLGNITTTVDMPAVGAYSQISVKGSLKTEKCFVLLSTVEFNVESCNLAENRESQSNSRSSSRNLHSRSNSECAGLFQFVDYTNPEYYDEFKEISYNEQEALLNKEKETNLEEINTKYNAIVTSLEKASDILNNIQ